MQAIKISVTGNTAAVTCLTPVTAGTVGMPVEFTFDESWAGLTKTAVFRVGERTMDCLGLELQTVVPWELLRRPGCHLFAGVYGCNQDGSLQIPTVWADLGVILPGADPTGDVSTDPSAPVWQQATAGMEKTENRVSVIDKASDDDHYPTAKAVRDHVAAEKYVIPLVASVDAKYFSIDPEFNFNWDEMVSAIQKGVPVFCLSQKDYSGLVRKFMLADLEADGGYATFSCTHYYTDSHQYRAFTIYRDGSTRNDSSSPDKTLTKYNVPADAHAVGERFKAVDKKLGFVRLAETVLTEDAVEIVWTQTQDGKPLSDYKDFFIYWTGKFTADVGANNATNSRFQCRGNGGIMYFSCQFPKKTSTENYAGWFSIEEITNDGNFAIWKSQFPNAFLRTGNGANIDYKVQGLPEACQTTVTDICCITNPAHTTLQKLHLGNTPESTSIFAAGTKAVLYGRART